MQKLTQTSFLSLFEQNESSKATYCLTAYIPLSEGDRARIDKILRVKLQDALRKSNLLNLRKEYLRKLIDAIVYEAQENINYHEGLAIFTKVSLDSETQGTNGSGDTIIFDLFSKPKEDFIIDRFFDFDQLLTLKNYKPDFILVNLERKSSEIYQRIDGNFNKCKHIKNATVYSEERPRAGRGSARGKKLERDEKRADKEFMNQVLKTIKEYCNTKTDIEFALVFHSNKFTDFSDELHRSLSQFGRYRPILVNKNYDDEKRLMEEGEERIKKFLADERQRDLKEARDEKKFIGEWDKVVQASREKRIEILFINEGARKVGYVDSNNENIYLSKLENFIKVSNVVPLMIKNVFESGGEVRLLHDAEFSVGAKIRY